MDLLSGAGTVLDTPGRFTRTALAGRNPFAAIFDPSQGVSGRDLLQQYGMVGENTDQGWTPDSGDIGGFLAEMALDPTNLIGGGLLAKILGTASKAKAANRGIDTANALSVKQRLQGFMPEEVAKLTKIVDETGQPKRMLHGTPESGIGVRELAVEHAGKNTGNKGFIGHGISFTDDPYTANQFTKPFGRFGRQQTSGAVLPAFIDSRSPRLTTRWDASQFLKELEDETGKALRPSGEMIPKEVNWIGDDPSSSDLLAYINNQGPIDATARMKELGYDASFRPTRRGNPSELTVFDPSQVYLPYIAKELQALQKVPNAKPLLAALLGQNVMARFGRNQQSAQ